MQWRALSREAAIAGQSLSAGLASLRKANYAMTGLYSHAFFSLSIGLERTLKLIYLLGEATVSNGVFPKEADLKTKFGHDINKLFSYVLQIQDRPYLRENPYPLSQSGIELEIVAFLTRFAKSTRYYNLNYLTGNRPANETDPISEWSTRIGAKILAKHYLSARKTRDENNATLIDAMLRDAVSVRHTAEDGSALDDVFSASMQTAQNRITQKYGTFYCASICRFLYMTIYELVRVSHSQRLDVPFLDEFFFTFMNDDSFLLSRKTFPPRGQ